MQTGDDHARREQGLSDLRRQLAAIRSGLAAIEARAALRADGASPPALGAARQALAGLRAVLAWLDAAAPAGAPAASAASAPSPPPRAARADLGSSSVADLAAHLRLAVDDLAALGEALEDEDPLLHGEAVQAVGLGVAVLEGAHQRLLRAGLIAPRRVSLLGP